jgi:hypothetical protein
VVEVGVGHDQRVEPVNALGAQRRDDDRASRVEAREARARVDEPRVPRRAHEHRIAVADVEEEQRGGDDSRVPRWPGDEPDERGTG